MKLSWLISAAGLYEGLAALSRFDERKSKYAAAAARAKQLGRPLIVVGDPDAGAHTRLARAYDCGDVCVDLNGCARCKTSWTVDITKQRLPADDDSAVVFESCVLEYVDDLATAWAELRRVAGDRANLFDVRVSPWTLTSWLFPGAKWQLYPPRAAVSASTGKPLYYTARRISDSADDGSKLWGLP